ncbi:phytoene desaturase family protein [Ohessyouella blattaphilus]|uniref:NAD(P)/FAD-dependent oxidoreductase n=1 Tax=Ohessyouella blattaphilus TaxID=2949333 RepID=A0ABT1ENL2_9FIRM|nr:NAD(P)/FAD-dependent oxidoreductase [Ohessyouella blattaphilus]MCP1111372.1 NAD(P)/FAD-dependent oxidoreductase [Ohessyouella blattaphilus]MCR8564766.1 NAD(P)/FAD-dependent oxidoreductase [Ohessyouella blattaphilus]
MKIAIVGGGIAGMSAGIYARQSGLDATIYEMHSIPGGHCTSWKRSGYLFEGGMHWLVGSSKKSPLHRMWQEVGALQDNNPVYNKDPFLTYMDKNGPICLYRDPNRLQDHLLKISPVDQSAINTLIKDIKKFGNVSMPMVDIRGVKVKNRASMPPSLVLSMISALPRMSKLNSISIKDYVAQFQHPGIRKLLLSVIARDDYAATSLVFTLGGLAMGDSGYPTGGSLRMAQNMAQTFKSLGGKLETSQKVERIEVKDGKAVGVWVNGTLHKAEAILVTQDTLAATQSLFSTSLREPWIERMQREITPINNEFICLGVKADLGTRPSNMIFPLDPPLQVGAYSYDTIGCNSYAKYEGYAPVDRTSLTCIFGQDNYATWKTAKENGTYNDKKTELAKMVIDRLAHLLPETDGKIELWDVATPLTYERYCGSWHGSWMSVMKPGTKNQQYPCKPSTISNLYFAGQRLMIPGGMPVAAYTGRQAVQHLCRDAGLVFQSMM